MDKIRKIGIPQVLRLDHTSRSESDVSVVSMAFNRAPTDIEIEVIEDFILKAVNKSGIFAKLVENTSKKER